MLKRFNQSWNSQTTDAFERANSDKETIGFTQNLNYTLGHK